MLDKLRLLRKQHLKAVHDVTFYPYQEVISDKIISALLENMRLTANATEAEIKKLERHEIPIEISRQCIAEGQTVSLRNGQVKCIESIQAGDEVVSFDGYKSSTSKVLNKWVNGIAECYEIRTRKGYTIVVTKNHKLLTPIGYKSIDDGVSPHKDIRINCHKSNPLGIIGISINNQFGSHHETEKAKILGYFIADGYCGNGQSPKFTTTTPEYRDDFIRLIKQEFEMDCTVRAKGNGWDIFPTNGSHATSNNAFINYLRDIDLYGKVHNNKAIPHIVFEYDKESLANFINRLISADGWCSKNEVGISAHTLHYAKQLRSLLTKFGIKSYINLSVGKKSTNDFYKVRVSDKDSLNILQQEIGVYNKNIVVTKAQRKTIGQRQEDIYWDYIVNMKPVGKRNVYDLEVDKTHNYVAEGLVVHNCGKTTCVVLTVEFIKIFFPKLFNRRVNIGIFAPQREQAKTDFDRLKEALFRSELLVFSNDKARQEYKEQSNANTLVLPNGASTYIFPVTKTSKPESKTLDLIIFEESQDLEDRIVKEQILPMGATTNAPVVYVGTAGTNICYYYRLGQSGKAIKMYFEQVASERRKTYEQTGNALHLIYEQTIRKEIELFGLESDEIQRPYFGKWLIGSGQFVTEEDLMKMVDENRTRPTYHEKKSECYVGIDVAKNPDSTVVTVLRYNQDTGKKEVLNWLEMNGENYVHQFDVIKQFISNYNVQAIAIDSTGVGDPIADMFTEQTEFINEKHGFYPVKFSAVSKDNIYRNLKISIKELLTTLPKLDTKLGVRFKQQMLDLQQEYKGQLLSVKHPEDPNAHDDYCFVAGTKILTDRGQVNIENIKIGDMVMTRKGYKPVVSIGNRKAEVITKFGLTGTPDHPFITTKGIKRFDSLTVCDKIHIWNEKLSSMEVRNITDIQTQKDGNSESTTGDTPKRHHFHYIDRFTLIILEIFQRVGLYITKIITHLTTNLTTWKLNLDLSTNQNICPPKMLNIDPERVSMITQDQKQLNGIKAKQQKNGTDNTLLRAFTASQKKPSAWNVDLNLFTQLKRVLSIVLNFVLQDIDVRTVYNFTVIDEHEYFANNILVHNCDSLALAEWAFARWNEDNNVEIAVIDPNEKKKDIIKDESDKVVYSWPGDEDDF